MNRAKGQGPGAKGAERRRGCFAASGAHQMSKRQRIRAAVCLSTPLARGPWPLTLQ